mgnify:CR=1 FL=1
MADQLACDRGVSSEAGGGGARVREATRGVQRARRNTRRTTGALAALERGTLESCASASHAGQRLIRARPAVSTPAGSSPAPLPPGIRFRSPVRAPWELRPPTSAHPPRLVFEAEAEAEARAGSRETGRGDRGESSSPGAGCGRIEPNARRARARARSIDARGRCAVRYTLLQSPPESSGRSGPPHSVGTR